MDIPLKKLKQLLATLEAGRAVSRVKVQPANAPGGRFTKDDFAVDLVARTRRPKNIPYAPLEYFADGRRVGLRVRF